MADPSSDARKRPSDPIRRQKPVWVLQFGERDQGGSIEGVYDSYDKAYREAKALGRIHGSRVQPYINVEHYQWWYHNDWASIVEYDVE